MNRTILRCLLLLLLAFGWQTGCRADNVTAASKQQRDMLHDGNALPHQLAAAILTDAHSALRIAGQRPQRLSPSNGSKVQTSRTSFRSQSQTAIRYKSHQNIHCPDCRCRQETAPHPTAASCAYYVIALRHIIR